MREILFRGKPVETVYDDYADETLFADGDFVYGSLIFDGRKPIIVGKVVDSDPEYINVGWWVYVRPETIGQYTGLNDKNGVKIFEGDIVKVASHYGGGGTIGYCPPSWGILDERGFCDDYNREEWEQEFEIIGNIHDNPELLEVE